MKRNISARILIRHKTHTFTFGIFALAPAPYKAPLLNLFLAALAAFRSRLISASVDAGRSLINLFIFSLVDIRRLGPADFIVLIIWITQINYGLDMYLRRN